MTTKTTGKSARAGFRSSLVLALVSALTFGGAVLAAEPALAAGPSGDLRAKGPAGSAYTTSPYVSQVGVVGSGLTYTVQIVNTGAASTRYQLKIPSTELPVAVYDGALPFTPLTDGPGGYYTRAIPAGGKHVLTLKVRVPSSAVTGKRVYETAIWLRATDGTYIDNLTLYTNEAAPKVGTTARDMFSRTGLQKAIGGSNDYQVLTASTISATGTARFTTILQNNSSAPARIHFQIADAHAGDCPSFVVKVKDGTTDVTAATFGATYRTPLLAPGSTRTLTISVTAHGADCSIAPYWYIGASSDGINWPDADLLVVNLAA